MYIYIYIYLKLSMIRLGGGAAVPVGEDVVLGGVGGGI